MRSGIVAIHLGGNIHQTMADQIAACMHEALGEFFLLRHWLQIDHRHVAALGKAACLVEHIGHATRHAGGKVAARFHR